VKPPTSSEDWLVYGANGYTARLIVKEAIERGLRPVIAGRNRDAVELLAARFDCPARTFALDDPSQVAKHLQGVRLVLNCAGPFSQTARTLIAACLEAKSHYLDITGEIDSIEHAAIRDAEARAADISIIPAVGFDVVPTDCLAAMLAAEMPDATHLALAFTGATDASPGTTKTVLENLPHGARARVSGRIEKVPFAWKKRTVPFHTGPREAVTIGWGDVASAYHTTGIQNIDTYIALGEIGARSMRRLRRFAPLLRFGPVLKLAGRLVDRFVQGPSPETLANERSAIWGEVRNAAGETRTASLETPNAYRLTALTAVAAVQRVLVGAAQPGFQTPARAFGPRFILAIPGVQAISGTPAVSAANRPS
jgi:short subunit dehydrogenase-like uncharacterized protein